jgi:hypothetical protein
LSARDGTPTPWRSLAVAAALILLALAAVIWPAENARRAQGRLLVLMPHHDVRREEALQRLAAALARSTRLDVTLEVALDLDGFHDRLDRAVLVLAPDAVTLSLPPESWQPMVTGRRRTPWNLRPTSVLVSRIDGPSAAEPWLSAPTRTVFGDSLSLVCRAAWCRREANATPAGVAWGDDPYDHRPVLEALRHGAFDHAVVRQWDLEAAIDEGWLTRSEWRITELGAPVPDVVVLASRRLPAGVRMEVQRALTVIGRELDGPSATQRELVLGLGLLRLDGFNLLIGPDFERFRRQYDTCWPRTGP